MFTVDIARAYKNFFSDPLDWPLFCLQWGEAYYVDVSMPFGARASSCFMQRVANFVSRILREENIAAIMYLDDVVVVAPDEDTAQAQYSRVCELFIELGLPEAVEKTQPPSTSVRWLVINIDAHAMCLSIPHDKAKCVEPARVFISRLLEALISFGDRWYIKDPAKMSEIDVCLWLEYLASKNISPGTIKSKLSHIRVYVRLVGGSLLGLNHIRVSRSVDAIHQRKDCVPKKKDAVPAEKLKAALAALPMDDNGLMVRTAALLMFYGALRQSEVAPPTVSKFDPQAHLTRADLIVGDTVTVTIKAGKNLQRFNQQKTVTLSATEDPLTCPVMAVRAVLQLTPNLPASAPLLVFTNKLTPMPTSYLRAEWVRTMHRIGVNHTKYSLHSLRKASATLAHFGGCSELEVQRHGGWSPAAYKTYIQTDNQRVAHVLSTSLN